MKANILWPIAVIVALVVGLLWQGQADAPPAKPRVTATTAPAVTAAQLTELQSRIDELEAEIDALKSETPVVVRAEVAPNGTGRLAQAKARTAVDVIGPSAGVAMPAEAVAEAINDTAVRNQLRKVIAAERQAERDKRWDRRQERAAERSRQMVADLAESVDLSEDQQAMLQSKLDEERAVIMNLFKSAREDGTWREAHKESQDVKASTDAQLKEALSAEQYARYQEMRDEANSWGRHGGGDRKKSEK